ncbi:tetratricopeptide repeat protein [Eisenibacter elegans]|jgi:tetratricopeptide (TPR) repeat protein|uniref:tetratricopeptide repeat protein n=1 Tax=Eisenibacter elegans TaxID=997 RepID=UPI000423C62E|nr:tetratricopeptide repeat protein [Eisenibacter elegans]
MPLRAAFVSHFRIFLFAGLGLMLLACDRYDRTDDTIYQLPATNNWGSEVSLKLLQDQYNSAPQNPEVLQKLSRWYLEQPDDTLALQYALKAVEATQEQDPAAQLLLAEVYQRLQQYSKALDAARKARKLGASNAAALLLMSELYLSEKKYTEAQTYLKQVAQIMPQDARIDYLHGAVALGKSDTAAAVVHLRKAIQKRPNYPDAYNALGEMYLRYEMYRRALAHFDEGLSQNPNHDRLNYNKAETYRALRFVSYQYLDSAVVYYRKALDANADLYQAAFNLGLLLYKAGNWKKAKEYFEYTLRYNDEIADVHYYLGLCYREEDKLEPALGQFEKALALDPVNFMARDYYWDTKARIDYRKQLARQDSIQKAYQEQQRKMWEQWQEEQKKQQELYQQQYQQQYKPPQQQTPPPSTEEQEQG